jgi:tripartite-type tricarboxylate transporter receptor subunit TctC
LLAPALPPVAESGLTGFEVTGWYGPATTLPAAVAKLNAEANRAPAIRRHDRGMRQQGLEPVGGSRAAATAWIRTEVARWTGIIRDAGIRAQ